MSLNESEKSSDFLSQEEVEALLMGIISSDPNEKYEETSIGKVKKYELGYQERIIRGRMPTLELINEYFEYFKFVSIIFAVITFGLLVWVESTLLTIFITG